MKTYIIERIKHEQKELQRAWKSWSGVWERERTGVKWAIKDGC